MHVSLEPTQKRRIPLPTKIAGSVESSTGPHHESIPNYSRRPMLKVRFSYREKYTFTLSLSTETQSVDFQYTEFGDRISLLIDDLIAVQSSVEIERQVDFCEEPKFVYLKFDKESEKEVFVTVSGGSYPLQFLYKSDCRSIVLAFWRGLRLLEEALPQDETLWIEPRPFQNLKRLGDLVRTT